MRDHLRSALAAAGRDQIIYDLTGIEHQYDTLLGELPGVRVRFAIKACPVDEVLTGLADRGSGFDAASPGEIRKALATGVGPERVHYGNTIKSDEDIAEAFRLGITTYATDSIEDVEAIARHAPGARVFCRVATSGEGAIWGLAGKCGTAEPAAVLGLARRLGLVPAGLSMHVGSQQMTVRAWEVAIDGLVAVVAELESAGIHLDHINLGGGLPAHGYLDRGGNRLTPPTAEIFAAIRDGMRRLRERGDLAFVVEPGRYLVADHGTIRASVARLTTRREPWLYMSCGKFNGLYESDQIGYRLEFPTRNGSRRVPAVIAGPSCDSDDAFGGPPVPVPADLDSGDPVWIRSAGAYATSYMTVGFNGFDPLPTVTVRAEHIRQITSGDWNAITELEAGAYGAHGLSEGLPALQSHSSPATSFVLDAGPAIGGYLLALPYPHFQFPDLSRPESTVFESSNLHLHDIVVGDEHRGRGWSRRLLRHLTTTAKSFRYERISLVAVNGMAGFWSSRGYRSHPEVTLPSSYGADAIYMSRELT